MKANDFLKSVLSSLGYVLGVEDELLVMVPTEEGYESKPVLSSNKYPFLLPTNKNLNRLLEVDEKNSKVTLKYLPFNPILEDDISFETQSFKTFLKRIQTVLTLETYETGGLLLSIAKTDTLVKSKGVRVEKFLTELGKHLTTKNMKVVDDTTIKTFGEIIKNSNVSGNHKLLHVTIKRRGEIDGRVYPVVASLYSPLAEYVMSLDEKEECYVNDVKLRKKDVYVFKYLFKTLLPFLDKDFVYRVPSDREDFPMFSSSYRLYLDVMGRHEEISSKLKDIIPEEYDPLSLKLEHKSDEIDGLVESIYKEITRIPSEKSLLTPTNEIPKEESEEIKEVVLPKQTNTPSVASTSEYVPTSLRNYGGGAPYAPVQAAYPNMNNGMMQQPPMGYVPSGYAPNGMNPMYHVNNMGYTSASPVDTVNAVTSAVNGGYVPSNMYGGGGNYYMVNTPMPAPTSPFGNKAPLGMSQDTEF